MRRPVPRRKPNAHSHAAQPAAPVNGCRALVRVDGAAIRAKIKQGYEKALRDLGQAREQLERFQGSDVPEYTRWFNGQFGALLTELRELTAKVTANEALIWQVEEEIMFGGGSPAQAYRRVMAAIENPPPAPPPPDAQADQGPAESGMPPGFDDELPGDEAHQFADFLNDFFGDGEAGDPQEGRPGPWGDLAGRRPKPAADAARVKDLYRKLVRLLHPDVQRGMTPQKIEWWHQAQTAYEAGDADQLEVILTLCEIDNGTAGDTSAGLLHRITAQLKRSLRQLNRQLSEHRRDRAWNFSNRSDHSLLAIRLRAEMSEDLENLRGHWQETEDQIARWKAAAERSPKPRRQKRQPRNQNLPF
jgi:hypothetical protein